MAKRKKISRKAANSKRYRDRKNALPVDYGPEDTTAALAYWEDRCPVCGTSLIGNYHLDHVIPLTDPTPQNPGTVPSNILPLCASCNASKCDQPLEVWLLRRVEGPRALLVAGRIRTFLAQTRQPEKESRMNPLSIDQARELWGDDILEVRTIEETTIAPGSLLRQVGTSDRVITELADVLTFDGNRIVWQSPDRRRCHVLALNVEGHTNPIVEVVAPSVSVVRSIVYVFQDGTEDVHVASVALASDRESLVSPEAQAAADRLEPSRYQSYLTDSIRWERVSRRPERIGL
jgi:hypothetical protein